MGVHVKRVYVEWDANVYYIVYYIYFILLWGEVMVKQLLIEQYCMRDLPTLPLTVL